MPAQAIVVDDLSKTFRIPKQHVNTLKERMLHPFQSRDMREYNVLRAIDFEVERGEFFGIVGRNGSGKSTLLKCMAGIYRPNTGTVKIAGRVAPFIELGVGFNPDLTAFDNVVINGVMMGLSMKEAKDRFDEIIDFAELGDYLDLKLKNYSSGMAVRLAFSVMVQASADILLIDEVLAVGDAAFQQKCFDVFYRLRDEGRTIVLVTHDMSAVERFCHRAMFIEDGDIKLIGDPSAVGRAYLAANFAGDEEQVVDVTQTSSGRVEALVAVLDAAGNSTSSLPSGEPVRLRTSLTLHEQLDYPLLHVVLRDAEHKIVTGTRVELDRFGSATPGRNYTIESSWDLVLADGHYDIGLGLVVGHGESEPVLDARTAAALTIHSAERDVVGTLQAPTTVNITTDIGVAA